MSEPTQNNAVIDITIPVLNEESCLERSITTLTCYLSSRCPYDWVVTVVDNGSQDATWSIANSMAASMDCLRPIRLDRRGRGAALKAAWSTSNADVLAYMDVDLSTSLDALPRLIEPLVAGLADVSIGSRLMPGARVQRSLRREGISRIYNLITRAAFGYGIRDAQCGFKAVSGDVARKLLADVKDDGWFFDTELLVLAWRSSFAINEVPVRWIEDDDSRVRIFRTAADDLSGIWRLRRQRAARGSSRGTDARAEALPSAAWQAKDPEEGETASEFDLYAPRYEKAVDQAISFTGRDSDFFAERKADLLETLAQRHLGDLRQLRVLDVGCGTGTTCRHLAERTGQLYGVDISKDMVDIARENVKGAKFEWYSGDRLPFGDATFDVVIAICALHHVPTPQRPEFLVELHRVTRQDGLVVVFEHNPLNPLTRWAVSSCDLDKGVTLVPGWRAAALARDAGATPLGQTNFLFTPFAGLIGRQIDNLFRWLPLGGQYAMTARAQHAVPQVAGTSIDP